MWQVRLASLSLSARFNPRASAAAPRTGLVTALYWWIPGIVIVGVYFAYIYSKMPTQEEE